MARTPTLARTIIEAAPTATLARRSAKPVHLDDAGTLTGRLVPWEVQAEVDDGTGRYTESFARGGMTVPAGAVIPVYAGHSVDARGRLTRGPLVGRLDGAESREDGLYGTVVLADVPAAAELRALARTVGATFSVEFEAEPADGTVVRTGIELDGVAVLTLPHRGAYAGAEVLAVRAAPDEPNGDEEPDEDDDGDDNGDDGDGTPIVPPAGAPTAARAVIAREVQRALGRVARPATHPLNRFTGPFEFYEAARASSSDELPLLFRDAYRSHRDRVTVARAFVDQVTTETPA